MASLAKWGIAGSLILMFGSAFLIERNHRTKVVKLVVIFFIVLGLFAVITLESNLFELFAKNVRGLEVPTLENYVHKRILREDSGDISGGRFAMWHQVVSDATRNPFMGKGMGVVTYFFSSIHGYEIIVNEHNIAFWLLNRIGFVGTILILLFGIKYYFFAYSVYRNEKNPNHKALLFSSLIFLLAIYLINLEDLWILGFESAIIIWLNVSIIFLMHRAQLAKSQLAAYGQLHRTVLD
jgi:O-antigen ligase